MRHAEYGLSAVIGPLSVGALVSGGDDYSVLRDSGSGVARCVATSEDNPQGSSEAWPAKHVRMLHWRAQAEAEGRGGTHAFAL